MKKTSLLFACATVLGLGTAVAQSSQAHNVAISIPQIAILDIETSGDANVSFAVSADGLEAGSALVIDEENSDLWINYTSVVQGQASVRTVTVETGTQETTIAGLVLKVEASAHSGSGGGQYGTPTAIVTPTDLPQNIITGIGSSFTGNGASNGHNLTYHLDFTGNFEDLNLDDANMTIEMTYTITD